MAYFLPFITSTTDDTEAREIALKCGILRDLEQCQAAEDGSSHHLFKVGSLPNGQHAVVIKITGCDDPAENGYVAFVANTKEHLIPLIAAYMQLMGDPNPHLIDTTPPGQRN